jgi:hypothetical protein
MRAKQLTTLHAKFRVGNSKRKTKNQEVIFFFAILKIEGAVEKLTVFCLM